jgi:hypothetical protein
MEGDVTLFAEVDWMEEAACLPCLKGVAGLMLTQEFQPSSFLRTMAG